MAAQPIPDNPNPVEAICAKANQLAVLPQVVHKILEMTGSEEASAGSIEQAIIVDPGFSSRVLAHANSAHYALSKKVTSIREAIMFLGFKALRQLAMTVGVFDLFVGKSDRDSLRRRSWWRHSLDTAHCSAWLATKTSRTGRDEAYTCGLLHMVGKNLLDRFGGADYGNVEVLTSHYGSEREAEKHVYGCDHIEVALAVSRQWGFPDVLVAGINYLDEPEANDDNRPLRACVCLSNLIARSALEPEKAHTDWPEWALEELGITPEQIPLYIEGGTVAIAAAAKLQI
ncbi:MAG: hypothetical protein HONBIEJF_02897 [Fimbriimonadaceae bacterium]|nr:hypothetical protein [Fimbriimonadaceae bacterium]